MLYGSFTNYINKCERQINVNKKDKEKNVLYRYMYNICS